MRWGHSSVQSNNCAVCESSTRDRLMDGWRGKDVSRVIIDEINWCFPKQTSYHRYEDTQSVLQTRTRTHTCATYVWNSRIVSPSIASKYVYHYTRRLHKYYAHTKKNNSNNKFHHTRSLRTFFELSPWVQLSTCTCRMYVTKNMRHTRTGMRRRKLREREREGNCYQYEELNWPSLM